MTAILFNALGTVHDVNDITAVRLYLDVNDNGIYEPGTDTQINGTGTYDADDGSVTISGFNQVVPANATQNWLVVYDLNGTASPRVAGSGSIIACT